MSRAEQKQRERNYVEAFKHGFISFPEGELVDNEEPDFDLITPAGNIGIEVTEIHQQAAAGRQSVQRGESERRKAIERAQSIYEEKGLPVLDVCVFFGGETNLNRNNRENFASILANLVASNTPPENSHIDLDNHWENPLIFPYEITAIGIIRHPALTKNFWSVPTGGVFQEDFVAELQQVISAKEIKLSRYRADVLANWLLVVAQGNGGSTFFDPSPETLNHRYSSSFQRVFFLDLFRRKVFELSLTMPE